MNRIRKKMHEVKRASRHVQFKDKQCLAIILATVVMFAVSALTVFEAIGLAARYGHLPVLSALSESSLFAGSAILLWDSLGGSLRREALKPRPISWGRAQGSTMSIGEVHSYVNDISKNRISFILLCVGFFVSSFADGNLPSDAHFSMWLLFSVSFFGDSLLVIYFLMLSFKPDENGNVETIR